jgi:hypothetical protein
MPAEDLLLCQRWYEKSFDPNTVPVQNAGTATGEEIFIAATGVTTTERSPRIKFKVTKNGFPAITLFSPAAATAQVYDETNAAACTSTTTNGASTNGFNVVTTSAGTTTTGSALGVHWVADARFV